jgi:hypothetical protein
VGISKSLLRLLSRLSTCAVFLDDASVLAKLDPCTWPERNEDIESRPSNDEVAQATKDFLTCRFDPNNLEPQLAKVSHF